MRLGSVVGPVIQATGRSEFEDGLGLGDYVSGYSYHMSVRTRLSDHTKQTKLKHLLIKISEGTALSVRSLVNPGPMTCGLAAIVKK
jgi:hypothetical protein